VASLAIGFAALLTSCLVILSVSLMPGTLAQSGLMVCLAAIVAGLAAAILGLLGLAKIKRSGGFLKAGAARYAGIVAGYLAVGICVIAGIIPIKIAKYDGRGPDATRCKRNMQSLCNSLFEFYREFGTFPADTLAARDRRFVKLAGPDCLKQMELFGSVSEPVNNLLCIGGLDRGNWTYFPDVNAEDASAETPVLISPPIRHNILVLHLDSTVDERPEVELAAIIRSSKTPPIVIPLPQRRVAQSEKIPAWSER